MIGAHLLSSCKVTAAAAGGGSGSCKDDNPADDGVVYRIVSWLVS